MSRKIKVEKKMTKTEIIPYTSTTLELTLSLYIILLRYFLLSFNNFAYIFLIISSFSKNKGV